MYEYCEDETIALCGDYNARVGGRPDFIDGVDEVPPRVNIDTFVNDHGLSLPNFCLQSNTCLVHGRINPLKDSYTTVSHRGKSVVDYFITRHDDLCKITDFEVLNISDFINA